MDLLQNRTFFPAISIFHLFPPPLPQRGQTSVAKLRMLMPSQLQRVLVQIRRTGKGNIDSLYLLVAPIHGSDAGQNIF